MLVSFPTVSLPSQSTVQRKAPKNPELFFSGGEKPNSPVSSNLSLEVLSPQGEWTALEPGPDPSKETNEASESVAKRPATQANTQATKNKPRGYSLYPDIPYEEHSSSIHHLDESNTADSCKYRSKDDKQHLRPQGTKRPFPKTLVGYNQVLAFFSIVGGIVWGGVFPQTLKLTTSDPNRYVETAPPDRIFNNQLPDKISEVLQNPNFHWQHLGHNKTNNTFYPIAPNHEFEQCKKTVATEMVLMLYARPDILDQLMKQHLHIKLINAPSYPLTNANQKNLNAAGHHCAMSSEMAMCIPEVNSSVGNPIDGYEVIRHEIGHWLDSINEDGINTKHYDGLLPGWNNQEIEQFKTLRTAEKGRLQQQNSVLRGYALEDDQEFLSVLIEAYFEKGQDLSQRSPGLYKMMDEYFTHPKSSRIYEKKPSAFAIALSSLLLLIALPNGAFMLLRRQEKKNAENQSAQQESSGC